MAPRTKKAAEAKADAQDDVSMTDAPAVQPGAADETYLEVEEQWIRILPGSSDTAASFEFLNEDHTLGNALRYMIMKNPDVEFCGYSIPHPSEPKMNVRIQTFDGVSAFDCLEKGLNDLMDLCDVVTEKFTEARANFQAQSA